MPPSPCTPHTTPAWSSVSRFSNWRSSSTRPVNFMLYEGTVVGLNLAWAMIFEFSLKLRAKSAKARRKSSRLKSSADVKGWVNCRSIWRRATAFTTSAVSSMNPSGTGFSSLISATLRATSRGSVALNNPGTSARKTGRMPGVKICWASSRLVHSSHSRRHQGLAR